MKRPILITGCAASGTKAISLILKRAKVYVEHERMGADGMASWFLAIGNTSHSPVYNRQAYFSDFKRDPIILHQTRHPLKAISTMQRFKTPSWEWILAHLPQISKKDSKILQAMKYWLLWNRKAEELAEWRYQIEELANVWDELAERIGRPSLLTYRKVCLAMNNGRLHTRRKKYKPLTWEILFKESKEIADRIVEQGERYGYQISKEL